VTTSTFVTASQVNRGTGIGGGCPAAKEWAVAKMNAGAIVESARFAS